MPNFWGNYWVKLFKALVNTLRRLNLNLKGLHRILGSHEWIKNKLQYSDLYVEHVICINESNSSREHLRDKICNKNWIAVIVLKYSHDNSLKKFPSQPVWKVWDCLGGIICQVSGTTFVLWHWGFGKLLTKATQLVSCLVYLLVLIGPFIRFDLYIHTNYYSAIVSWNS